MMRDPVEPVLEGRPRTDEGMIVRRWGTPEGTVWTVDDFCRTVTDLITALEWTRIGLRIMTPRIQRKR